MRAVCLSPAGISGDGVVCGQRGGGEVCDQAGDGNAEDPLASSEEVDDFVAAATVVDGDAVAEQRGGSQVVDSEVCQCVQRGAYCLQQQTGIQQGRDDCDDEDVQETVEPAGPGPDGGRVILAVTRPVRVQ